MRRPVQRTRGLLSTKSDSIEDPAKEPEPATEAAGYSLRNPRSEAHGKRKYRIIAVLKGSDDRIEEK